MTADLAASCDAIAAWLPVAHLLARHPDTDGTTGGGKPGSRPPWNGAAAMAELDAHEGVRRLEASLRLAVTGRTGPRRGGSDAATMAAIVAIENLAHGLPVRHEYVYDDNGKLKPCHCPHCRAVAILERWISAIRQLPAVDKDERARKIAGKCPYCGFPMLRTFPRSGRVTCLRVGVCFDADGRHPVGTMEVGRLGAQVRWQDGLVAP